MQTNTHPINVVLSPLTITLTQSLNQSPPDSLADPRIESLVNSKTISLQLSIADRLHDFTLSDPQDRSTTSKLLRVLTLLERTQSRIARAAPKAPRADATPQREEAHHFLQGELSSGTRPASEILAAAQKLGIAKRTLLRAKSDLNISSNLIHNDDNSRSWMWSYTPVPA